VGRFDYYRKLSAADRRVYDRSDAIQGVSLPRPAEHRARTATLKAALASEDRRAVEQAARALTSGIAQALGAPAVRVRVLAKRPKDHEGELHGLYTLEEDGRAHIEVWMRTAEQRRVVAFRTFLRTLAHEICHHLDLTHFRLRDTFHTEGFFRRESNLVMQLLDPADSPSRPRAAKKPSPSRKKSEPSAEDSTPRQLSLFT